MTSASQVGDTSQPQQVTPFMLITILNNKLSIVDSDFLVSFLFESNLTIHTQDYLATFLIFETSASVKDN